MGNARNGNQVIAAIGEACRRACKRTFGNDRHLGHVLPKWHSWHNWSRDVAAFQQRLEPIAIAKQRHQINVSFSHQSHSTR
eukprot:1099856-Amphidinium_carterae.1